MSIVTKVTLCALIVNSALLSSAYASSSPTGEDKHHHEKRSKHEEQDTHHEGEHKEEHGHHDDHHGESIERIKVRASRLGKIVTDGPTRIEIINGEEIQEKALMRPGNISMLVAETGGVRVQTTSPALGSANIRLQGLFGRYTQLLSDGLPLYGGQSSSLGLLQIPPTDLANVEIIKGSASSMYGGSALGGVINLISRQPGDEFEGEVLTNITSKNGQDVTGYFASPINEHLATSITAGVHNQVEQDLDDDGWIDLAGYQRVTARPRLYWTGDNGENLYVTAGVMSEEREGGSLEGQLFGNNNAYIISQTSNQSDLGFVFDKPVGESSTFSVRGSAMQQQHDHVFGNNVEVDEHQSYLIESSYSSYNDNASWVVGAAVLSEKLKSETYSELNYDYQVPGIFGQYDHEFSEEWSSSASARIDWHNEYGTQVSPRISLLYKPDDWTIRGSYGEGFFAPSPFVEEIENTGLSRLAPLNDLDAEKASTASLDMTYVYNSIETAVTLFSSDVTGVTELVAIEPDSSNNFKSFKLVNTDGENQIRGAELLLRYRWNDVKLTGSYLYTDATKPSETNVRTTLPLTPKHSAGAVVMWERHGEFLVGFEAYYTGKQKLENNPYRDESKPYWHLGLLGQITRGRFSYFINFENLLDIRQTKEDPLVLPVQAANGSWTTDIWSRNDGFTINAGIRYKFGH